MKCTVCLINQANNHPIYGQMPCNDCNLKRSTNSLPNHQIEFTSQSVKDQRREYASSIVQPWRSGEPSREFIETQPHKAKQYYTPKEMKKAKNVWSDIHKGVEVRKTK